MATALPYAVADVPWPPSEGVASTVFGDSFDVVCERVCGGLRDDDFMQDILRDFFTTMGKRTQDAPAALEAMRAGESSMTTLNGRTMSPRCLLHDVVHGIKGTAGNLGLMRIHALAKSLQDWMDTHTEDAVADEYGDRYQGLLAEVETERKTLGFLPPLLRCP